MSNHPQTVGLGAANAPGQDPRRQDAGTVAETTDSFDDNLTENDRAGQHGGAHTHRTYTAYDVKMLHERMSDFTNAELKLIPVLAHGERLLQGATYLDLSVDPRTPFVAQGSQEAQDPHLYVAKASVAYPLWNKLTGVNH